MDFNCLFIAVLDADPDPYGFFCGFGAELRKMFLDSTTKFSALMRSSKEPLLVNIFISVDLPLHALLNIICCGRSIRRDFFGYDNYLTAPLKIKHYLI